MNKEQNDNSGASPGAPGKNPAAKELEARSQKTEEKGSEALQSSPNSQLLTSNSPAEPRPADPFFSGRRHFPELDGLRGLAILLVLLCHYRDEFGAFGRIGHALAHVFGWGWVGVDLFFVLSGFLITGILYDAKGQGKYFKNFYARRFLRIFPLYYGFLAAFLLGLIVYRFGFPQDFAGSAVGHALWRYQPWLWTYTFNFRCAIHGNAGLVVGQFWTLSIEEQFYLFWPLVVFLLPRRKLSYACVVIVAGSLVLRLIATEAGVSAMAIYTATPFQLDALATGSLLAMLVRGPVGLGPVHVRCGAVVGIVSVLLLPAILALRYRLLWLVDLRYTVLATLFGSLLLLTVLGRPAAFGSLFRSAWLRWLGKFSYGIYVFHLPILTVLVGVDGLFGWAGAIAGSRLWSLCFVALNVTVTFSLAYASYHLYEKHFLKLKKNFPERAAAPIAGGYGPAAGQREHPV